MGYCSRCDAMRNFRPGNYKPICLTCLQLKAKPCLCGADMVMHDSALSQNQPFMFFLVRLVISNPDVEPLIVQTKTRTRISVG
jgi:hypothetical protein